MITHTVMDANGRHWPLPVVEGYELPSLESYEAERLSNQVVARWTLTKAAWDRTPNPVVSGVSEVIEFDTESIAGDSYNSVRHAFVPGVPGWYNFKVYAGFTLSPAAITTVQLTDVELRWRLVYPDGSYGTWEPLGGMPPSWTAAAAPNYWTGARVSGADTYGITDGYGFQFGYVVTTGGNITWFDTFYARFVIERVADYYGETGTCCPPL